MLVRYYSLVFLFGSTSFGAYHAFQSNSHCAVVHTIRSFVHILRWRLNLGLFDPHNTGVFVVRVYNPVSLGHHRVVLEMQVAIIGSVAYIMLLEQVSKSLHTKSMVFIGS